MGTIFYFEEDEKKKSVIIFVKDYKEKKWFRKERIDYTLSAVECKGFTDPAVMGKVCERIRKDYERSKIDCCGYSDFEDKFALHAFWLICLYDDDGTAVSYFNYLTGKEVKWTDDIEDAELYLDEWSAKESCDNVRKIGGIGVKVAVKRVYLNVVNGLLEPCFMITCTSKSNDNGSRWTLQ